MKEIGMQFSKDKGRSTVLWGVGIFVGLLLFAVTSKYYMPHVSLEDTYKNIVKKNEIISQMRINLLKSEEMEKNSVMALTDEESHEFADKSLAASAAVEQDLKLLKALTNVPPLQDQKGMNTNLEKRNVLKDFLSAI